MAPLAIQAAGCLVWRQRAGRLEVLLIHRPRYDDWSWPKGKLEREEHPLVCALRETVEETGLDVVLGVRLPTVEYRLRTGRVKRVHYWAAQVAGQADIAAVIARGHIERAANGEVDAVQWVRAGRARRVLTRRSDRVPLDELAARFRVGTLKTRAVIILRHAQAVPRDPATPPDQREDAEATRPLTVRGEQRSDRLVPLLAAFGIAKILTSPWKRCRRTVRPYARAAGIRRRRSPALTETAAAANPAEVATIVRRALASKGHSVVICTHRPVLPTVLHAVERACLPSADLRQHIPQADPYLRKGQMMVAHTALGGPWRGKVVALDLYRPSVGTG